MLVLPASNLGSVRIVHMGKKTKGAGNFRAFYVKPINLFVGVPDKFSFKTDFTRWETSTKA
jgi:hypothetical protein